MDSRHRAAPLRPPLRFARADTKGIWTKQVFYGMEHDLLLFNMITYAMFDYWLQETMSSVLITYLVEKLVVGIRQQWGASNLATKTMIDSRFLT